VVGVFFKGEPLVASLTYTGPFHETRRYDLTDDRTVIGRQLMKSVNASHTERADIELDGDEVSRQHAAVFVSDGLWYLEDIGSRNHTFLNKKINVGGTPRLLRDRDRIVICRYCFTFHQDSPDPHSSVNVRIETDDSDLMPASSISVGELFDSEDSSDSSRRLAVLIEMARSLQTATSPEDVLPGALEGLFRVLPAVDRGIIGFVNDDGFVAKSWKCRKPEVVGRIDVSQTIVRQVVENGQALLFDDYFTPLPPADSIHTLPLSSVICAPLMDPDGKVFGILQVDSARPRDFDAADLELVTAVAIHVSLAIHMARAHVAALQQRALERDVENAREVQWQFLPQTAPEVEGYEFAWFYEAARTIGGDYFDIVKLADGRVAIVLADVEGKGIPAALYMARLATETRACLEWFDDAAEIIGRLNARLQAKFATFAMAILDPMSHNITVVNAGHRPPTICRQDGTLTAAGHDIVEWPFSVSDDIVFQAATLPIARGESVVMFSDGFEDALNKPTEERYGIERINEVIRQADQSANEKESALVRSVRDFTGETPQFDDMCLVVCRRL
jgi:phosphoserine phosphatase RsbU/P